MPVYVQPPAALTAVYVLQLSFPHLFVSRFASESPSETMLQIKQMQEQRQNVSPLAAMADWPVKWHITAPSVQLQYTCRSTQRWWAEAAMILQSKVEQQM